MVSTYLEDGHAHVWSVGMAMAGLKNHRLSGGNTMPHLRFLHQGLESDNLAVQQFQANIFVEALLLQCHLDVQHLFDAQLSFPTCTVHRGAPLECHSVTLQVGEGS